MRSSSLAVLCAVLFITAVCCSLLTTTTTAQEQQQQQQLRVRYEPYSNSLLHQEKFSFSSSSQQENDHQEQQQLPAEIVQPSCNKSFGDQSPCPDSVSMVWAEGSMTQNFSAGAIQHGGLELKLSLCCGYQFHSVMDIPDLKSLRKLNNIEIDRVGKFLEGLVDRGPREVKQAARESMFPFARLHQQIKTLVAAEKEKQRSSFSSSTFGGLFSSSSSSSSNDNNNNNQNDQEDNNLEVDLSSLVSASAPFPIMRLSEDRRVLFLKAAPVPSFEVSPSTFDRNHHQQHIIKYVVHHQVLDCQCPRSFRVPQTALFVDDSLPSLGLSGGGNLCQTLEETERSTNSNNNNNNVEGGISIEEAQQAGSSSSSSSDHHQNQQFRISITDCDSLLPIWMESKWSILRKNQQNLLLENQDLVNVEQQSSSSSSCAITGVSGFDFDVLYTVRVNVSVGKKNFRVLQTSFTRRRKPVPLLFSASGSTNNILYGRSAVVPLRTPFFHPESFVITCRAPLYTSNTNPFLYQNSNKNNKQYEDISLCFVNDTAIQLAGLKPTITRILCEVSDPTGACGRGVLSELPNVLNVQAQLQTQDGDINLQQKYERPECRKNVFWHKSGQHPLPDGSIIQRRMCGPHTKLLGLPLLPPSMMMEHSLGRKYYTKLACADYSMGVQVESDVLVETAPSSSVSLLLPSQRSFAGCLLTLHLRKDGEGDGANDNDSDSPPVLDFVTVEVTRVQRKYGDEDQQAVVIPITTKTTSLEVPSPFDDGNALGYWFVQSPLSILPDKKTVNTPENNNNNNDNNRLQSTARIGNLPYPRQGQLSLTFVEESIWPCKELAWNATIDVTVAPPEKPISPRCFWTDKNIYTVSDETEPAAPDEDETFRMFEKASTANNNNVSQDDFQFVPFHCFPCSVDGQASLSETNPETHSATISDLNEGRCVEMVRTIGNAAGSYSAPYIVRRCTTVPTSVCSTAQNTLQGRAFSSITDTVKVSAPELPDGLEGEWICDRGDVIIEDPLNKPHEVTIKNLPRGQTLCSWSIQGKGEGGRDKHLCPSCTSSVRVIAAASDCPDTLQQVCSDSHQLPLYDTNLVNREMAMNLQYELRCENNNNNEIITTTDMIKGVMHVSQLPLGDLNCTLFASGKQSSNTRECPIVFSRRLPPSNLRLFRTDLVEFFNAPEQQKLMLSTSHEGSNRNPAFYAGIAGHPYLMSVNVSLPATTSSPNSNSFSAYSAYWTFRPKGTAASVSDLSKNQQRKPGSASVIFTSFSESGTIISDDHNQNGDTNNRILTFSTSFLPKERGLYTVSVSIRDPTNVCPDVTTEVQGTIVDAEVHKETTYSCGASATIKSLAVPDILSSVIDSRWVLAARSSNNLNCSRAQIVEHTSPTLSSSSSRPQPNNGVATIQRLGFGLCTFDWIVTMRHNASMARWKSSNIDTLSENVPPNGTSYLVASDSLSLWVSTASSDWSIQAPPDVHYYRAFVRKSPSGRSILIDGLELPPLHKQLETPQLPPYIISYRPYPLKSPPHGAIQGGSIECPRHYFTVTRVNVTLQGRLEGLSSECDLVRGGLVVLELSGASHVKFRTDFSQMEKDIRRMNSNSNNNNNNNNNDKFWTHPDNAEWSDFSIDENRRILRFRLRMRRFVDSRELDNVDFFENTKIPLSIFRGLSGTGPSSYLPMKKSGKFITPILPKNVNVGMNLDYDPERIQDTSSNNNNNIQKQEQEQLASFELNPPDIFLSKSLSSFPRFEKNLISVSEYDFASGNVHFNVSFKENILRPVPRLQNNHNNGNGNNKKSNSLVNGITNFSSCPVYNKGKQVSSQIAPLTEQPLTGRCALFDEDETEDNNNDAQNFMLNTRLGPGRYFTIDRNQVSVLRISKRSLCGLCDARLNPYHREAIENMIAIHEEDQKNWTKFVLDRENRENMINKEQQQQQQRGAGTSSDSNKNNNNNTDSDKNAPDFQHQQYQSSPSSSTTATEETTEDVATFNNNNNNASSSTSNNKNQQQQQRCATTPVDFSTNDWVTVGALNVLPETTNLISTRRHAKQCAIAYGIKSFTVQSRHGFFLHPMSSVAAAHLLSSQPSSYQQHQQQTGGSSSSSPTDFEIPLNISLGNHNGEYVDEEAFNIMKEHLKPRGILRPENPRQLFVSVQPVPQLQIQKSKQLVLNIEVPNEYYFNGFDDDNTMNNNNNSSASRRSYFTLTIHRSHASMEILTSDRERTLTHVCENTVKQFGVVARISLEGDTWHKTVGNDKVNGANIAMINGFYDTPHASSFEGGMNGVSNSSSPSSPSALTSPFVSYLATVLKPHHVKRVSDTVIEIEVPPCIVKEDEPLPACALISGDSSSSSSGSSSSNNRNNNNNQNTDSSSGASFIIEDEFFDGNSNNNNNEEPNNNGDEADLDDMFGTFLASELISFAVPGAATSCPGCLVAQPPMNVLGLAASVQPSLDPTPLQEMPSMITTSRLYNGFVSRQQQHSSNSGNNNNALLPREIYLHSLCSRWAAPSLSSSTSSSSSSSFWSTSNNLRLRKQQQRRRDSMMMFRNGNSNNNNQDNNAVVLKDDINSVIVGIQIRSPTVLAIRLGPIIQQQGNNNNQNFDGLQDNSNNNNQNQPSFANALIPVPVDWLYNSSVKMSPAEPWLVTLEYSREASLSGSAFYNAKERQTWYAKLRYSICMLVYCIFNAYLWLLCVQRFLVSPSFSAINIQIFMTHPVSVGVFALSGYTPLWSFVGAVLAFAPWLALAIMSNHTPMKKNDSSSGVNNGNSSSISRRGAVQQNRHQAFGSYPQQPQREALPPVFVQLVIFHVCAYLWLSTW